MPDPIYIHFKNDFDDSGRSTGAGVGFKIMCAHSDLPRSYYGAHESRDHSPWRPTSSIADIEYLGDIAYLHAELYEFLINSNSKVIANEFDPYFLGYRDYYNYDRESVDPLRWVQEVRKRNTVLQIKRLISFYDDLQYYRHVSEEGTKYPTPTLDYYKVDTTNSKYKVNDGVYNGDPYDINYYPQPPINEQPLLNFPRIFQEEDMLAYYVNFGDPQHFVQTVSDFASNRLIRYLLGNNQEQTTYFLFQNMIQWFVYIEVMEGNVVSDLSTGTLRYAAYDRLAELTSEINLRMDYKVTFWPRYTTAFTEYYSKYFDNQYATDDSIISSFELAFDGPPKSFSIVNNKMEFREVTYANKRDKANAYSSLVDQVASFLSGNSAERRESLHKVYQSKQISIPFKISNVPNGFLRSMVSDVEENFYYDALNIEFYIKPIVVTSHRLNRESGGGFDRSRGHLGCYVDLLMRDLNGYQINYDYSWKHSIVDIDIKRNYYTDSYNYYNSLYFSHVQGLYGRRTYMFENAELPLAFPTCQLAPFIDFNTYRSTDIVSDTSLYILQPDASYEPTRSPTMMEMQIGGTDFPRLLLEESRTANLWCVGGDQEYCTAEGVTRQVYEDRGRSTIPHIRKKYFGKNTDLSPLSASGQIEEREKKLFDAAIIVPEKSGAAIESDDDYLPTRRIILKHLMPDLQNIVYNSRNVIHSVDGVNFLTRCGLYSFSVLGIEFYPKKIMLGEKDSNDYVGLKSEDCEYFPASLKRRLDDKDPVPNAPDSYHGDVFNKPEQAGDISNVAQIKFHPNTFGVSHQVLKSDIIFKFVKPKPYKACLVNAIVNYHKFGLAFDTDSMLGGWEADRTAPSHSTPWTPVLSTRLAGQSGVKNIGRFLSKSEINRNHLVFITERGEDYPRIVENWFRDAPRSLEHEEYGKWTITNQLGEPTFLNDNTTEYYLPLHPYERIYATTRSLVLDKCSNLTYNDDYYAYILADGPSRLGMIPKYLNEDPYIANVGQATISDAPVTSIANPGFTSPTTVNAPPVTDTTTTTSVVILDVLYTLPDEEYSRIKATYNLDGLTRGGNFNFKVSVNNESTQDVNLLALSETGRLEFFIDVVSIDSEYTVVIVSDKIAGGFATYDVPSVRTLLDGEAFMPPPNKPINVESLSFVSFRQSFSMTKPLLDNPLFHAFDTVETVRMKLTGGTVGTQEFESVGIETETNYNQLNVSFVGSLEPETTYAVSVQFENTFGKSEFSDPISVTTPAGIIPLPVFSIVSNTQGKVLTRIRALLPSASDKNVSADLTTVEVEPVNAIQIQYRTLQDGVDEVFTDIGVGVVTADNLLDLNNLPTDLIQISTLIDSTAPASIITTNLYFPTGSFELRARFVSVSGSYGLWTDPVTVTVNPISVLQKDTSSFAVGSEIDEIKIILPSLGTEVSEKCFNVLDILPLTDDLICVLRNTGNVLQAYPTYLQILKQQSDSELEYKSLLSYSIEGYRPSFFNNFIKLTTQGYIIQLIDNNQEIKSIGINISATGSASITEDPNVSSVELPDISISTDRALPVNKPDNGAYINNNYINSTNKGNFSVNNFFEDETNLIVEQPWQKWLDTGLGEDIIEGNVVFWDDSAFLIEDDDGIPPIEQSKLPQKPSMLNVRKISASANSAYVGYDILEVILQHNDLYNKRFIDYIIERYDNNTNQWVNQSIDSINIDYNDVNHKTTIRFRVFFRYGPSKYRVAARALDYFNQVVKGDYAEFSKLFTNLLTEDFDGN